MENRNESIDEMAALKKGLEEYRKFFENISPLLDKLDANPELAQAIVDGKVDNELAIAVVTGEIERSPIRIKKAPGQGIDSLQMGINRALEAFYNKHIDLLVRDVNERSMTHKLAEELQKIFNGWDVDCEFNRVDGDLPKKLFLDGEDISSDETDAKTVYPDIIVHERGSRDYNFVAIEVKKDGRDTHADEQKLKGFTTDLSYEYGLLIVLKQDIRDTLKALRFFTNGEEHSLQQINGWEEQAATHWNTAPLDQGPDWLASMPTVDRWGVLLTEGERLCEYCKEATSGLQCSSCEGWSSST